MRDPLISTELEQDAHVLGTADLGLDLVEQRQAILTKIIDLVLELDLLLRVQGLKRLRVRQRFGETSSDVRLQLLPHLSDIASRETPTVFPILPSQAFKEATEHLIGIGDEKVRRAERLERCANQTLLLRPRLERGSNGERTEKLPRVRRAQLLQEAANHRNIAERFAEIAEDIFTDLRQDFRPVRNIVRDVLSALVRPLALRLGIARGIVSSRLVSHDRSLFSPCGV